MIRTLAMCVTAIIVVLAGLASGETTVLSGKQYVTPTATPTATITVTPTTMPTATVTTTPTRTPTPLVVEGQSLVLHPVYTDGDDIVLDISDVTGQASASDWTLLAYKITVGEVTYRGGWRGDGYTVGGGIEFVFPDTFNIGTDGCRPNYVYPRFLDILSASDYPIRIKDDTEAGDPDVFLVDHQGWLTCRGVSMTGPTSTPTPTPSRTPTITPSQTPTMTPTVAPTVTPTSTATPATVTASEFNTEGLTTISILAGAAGGTITFNTTTSSVVSNGTNETIYFGGPYATTPTGILGGLVYVHSITLYGSMQGSEDYPSACNLQQSATNSATRTSLYTDNTDGWKTGGVGSVTWDMGDTQVNGQWGVLITWVNNGTADATTFELLASYHVR